ncbi:MULTISPECIES: type VII secretion target [Mycolicibacterium]|uniref:ESX-1 secretion-associated protein n=2 Tax=Mycolicibacterium TaxID=1866885 RepID=A0A6N4UKK2_9MYCO|nr:MULTISPECIES: type VII secretion target [Mycolicibacterium]MBP2451665.1 hypothetical protein [Mycolicibacterium lutetiense]MCV6999426.1 hypothetical protein [Mycolicibacterium alvei]BBX25330.1 hypothetical protein MALV_04550 [Mycolicibacterium alvei]
MADLRVNTDGLTSAAMTGDDVAASLATSTAGGPGGNRQGHAGVAAMDAALTSVRDRQSGRASELADGLRVATGSYQTTDSDGADDIAVTL